MFATLAPALQRSSLIVCATGNKALAAKHFRMLRPGTVVAPVTSSDDELDLTGVDDTHDRFDHSPHLVEYVSRSDNAAMFWLINDGQVRLQRQELEHRPAAALPRAIAGHTRRGGSAPGIRVAHISLPDRGR